MGWTLEFAGQAPNQVGWDWTANAHLYEVGTGPENPAAIVDDDQGTPLRDVDLGVIRDWVRAAMGNRGGARALRAIDRITQQQAAAQRPAANPNPGGAAPVAAPPAGGNANPAAQAPRVDMAPDLGTYHLVVLGSPRAGIGPGVSMSNIRLIPDGAQIPANSRTHRSGPKLDLVQWIQNDVANRGGDRLLNVLMLLERSAMTQAPNAFSLFTTVRPGQQQNQQGRGRQRGQQRQANLRVNQCRIAEGVLPDNFNGLFRQATGTRLELISWISSDMGKHGGQDMVNAISDLHSVLAPLPAARPQAPVPPAAPVPAARPQAPGPRPAPASWLVGVRAPRRPQPLRMPAPTPQRRPARTAQERRGIPWSTSGSIIIGTTLFLIGVFLLLALASSFNNAFGIVGNNPTEHLAYTSWARYWGIWGMVLSAFFGGAALGVRRLLPLWMSNAIAIMPCGVAMVFLIGKVFTTYPL